MKEEKVQIVEVYDYLTMYSRMHAINSAYYPHYGIMPGHMRTLMSPVKACCIQGLHMGLTHRQIQDTISDVGSGVAKACHSLCTNGMAEKVGSKYVLTKFGEMLAQYLLFGGSLSMANLPDIEKCKEKYPVDEKRFNMTSMPIQKAIAKAIALGEDPDAAAAEAANKYLARIVNKRKQKLKKKGIIN